MKLNTLKIHTPSGNGTSTCSEYCTKCFNGLGWIDDSKQCTMGCQWHGDEVINLCPYHLALDDAYDTCPPSPRKIDNAYRVWASLQSIPTTANYTDVPEFGHVMTVQEFRENVKSGMLIDYDGTGHPMCDGLEARDMSISPTSERLIPLDATHICWYNR